MRKQIKHLFGAAKTIVAVISVCFALWVIVGACIGLGFAVGKSLAGNFL